MAIALAFVVDLHHLFIAPVGAYGDAEIAVRMQTGALRLAHIFLLIIPTSLDILHQRQLPTLDGERLRHQFVL